MTTLARVVNDGAEGTTRHAQDITGGHVLARGDIAIVDVDLPHEADLVSAGILRILGYIPTGPDLSDPIDYIPSDPSDARPSSLEMTRGDGNFAIDSRPSFGFERGYTYGQIYLPSYALGDDVRIVEHWAVGVPRTGWDYIVGATGRNKQFDGVGVNTTLSSDTFYDGSASVLPNLTDVSGFPAAGTVRLVSGDSYMEVNYTGIGDHSLTGAGERADINTAGGVTDFNWPAGTVVQVLVNSTEQTTSWNILGFFGWWDPSESSMGFYYQDYATGEGAWQDFGGGTSSTVQEQVFIDVGDLGWQTELAEDWTVDISSYTGAAPIDLGAIHVVDTTGFPDSTFITTSSSDVRTLIFEGDPITLTDPGSTQPYIALQGYIKSDTTHLEGGFYGDKRFSGTTHTFPAGSKVIIPTWFSVPLVNGLTIPYRRVSSPRGPDSVMSTDSNSSPISLGSTGPFSTPVTAGQEVWTVMTMQGSEFSLELWTVDPTTPGANYLMRLRVRLNSTIAIQKFVQGGPYGWGPFGWYEPANGSLLLDWSYTLLPPSGVFVPDNAAAIEVPLVVTGAGVIADVSVGLYMTSTGPGDLDITLIHPDLTEVRLAAHAAPWSSSKGFQPSYMLGSDIDTPIVIKDGAPDVLNQDWTIPPNDFTGGPLTLPSPLSPLDALSGLNGKPKAGTWKLRLKDNSPSDISVLRGFGLSFDGSTPELVPQP